VHEAVKATGANTSVIYVPPVFAADAMMEAADAGIPVHRRHHRSVPVLDMTRVLSLREGEGRALLVELSGAHHAGQSKVASSLAASARRATSAS